MIACGCRAELPLPARLAGWTGRRGWVLIPSSVFQPVLATAANRAAKLGTRKSVVRARAIFLYGVSAGLAMAWGVTALLVDDSADAGWFAVGAAVALAGGLITHRKWSRLEMGRRWRKTRP